MHRVKPQLARARKLARILEVPAYRRALRHGVAASVEHEAIPFRRHFGTVIDAGANRGQFAVFATYRFSDAALICVEPLSQPRGQLIQAVGATGRLRVFDVALSNASGTAEFHVAKTDDSSSLLPIGRRQEEMFPGTEEARVELVTVRRLDELVREEDLCAPVLLKIDVQGGELAVLEGATRLLDAIHAVLVEVSFVELYTDQPLADEVWAFLRRSGFVCNGIWSVAYGPRNECLQGDFLFSRPAFNPLSD